MINKTDASCILIVEDEDTVSSFIALMLSSNGYICLQARSGREALVLFDQESPDLILLDMGLPDQDGAEVLRTLRKQSTVPVIVVSARGHEREKVKALDLGADDYITKPFGTEELLARIRTALRHSAPAAAQEKQLSRFSVGDLLIDYEKRLVLLRGEKIHLTPTEYKIVVLLSRQAGRVLTYDALVRAVWGPYTNENPVLRVNMANIRRKIENNPGEPRYILTEVGVGYRMAEE